MIQGITIQATQPVNPIIGDAYFNQHNNVMSIFDGMAWCPLVAAQIPTNTSHKPAPRCKYCLSIKVRVFNPTHSCPNCGAPY